MGRIPKVSRKAVSTDVCADVRVAVVYPGQTAYRQSVPNQWVPLKTSGRFVIPLWIEVEWIGLMFTIRSQHNSLTDSNESCFIPKRLLVHGTNTRIKKSNENECNLRFIVYGNERDRTILTIVAMTIILTRRGLRKRRWHFFYVLYSDIMCSNILKSSLHT